MGTAHRDDTRCYVCESTMTYIRLKTKERVCRICGHVGKIKNEKRREV